jgi:D-methionine transport system substrate-binding protein
VLSAGSIAAARGAHGYAITPIAPTVTLPMAFYSRRLLNLNQHRPGATIAIPDDARGCAPRRPISRAIACIRRSCACRMRGARALDTAAFVAMENNDAARAGLQPARDSIGIEDARSPYADVLAVRDADRAQPWAHQLVAAYHSNDVAHFILTRYQDSVRRPW